MHVWDVVSSWLLKAKEEPFFQVEIVDHTAEKAQLTRQLLNKEQERQRIIEAWRKGGILTLEDVEQQMKAIDAEKIAIEAQLQRLESQDAVYAVVQEKYDRVREMMRIDLEYDQVEKRRLLEMG